MCAVLLTFWRYMLPPSSGLKWGSGWVFLIVEVFLMTTRGKVGARVPSEPIGRLARQKSEMALVRPT
jgi:hypothetical protein